MNQIPNIRNGSVASCLNGKEASECCANGTHPFSAFPSSEPCKPEFFTRQILLFSHKSPLSEMKRGQGMETGKFIGKMKLGRISQLKGDFFH